MTEQTAKKRENKVLRRNEYYAIQDVFDGLYAKSKQGSNEGKQRFLGDIFSSTQNPKTHNTVTWQNRTTAVRIPKA